MIGRITDIERYAINDGFGLRTTVFFKGCPLRCRWCSNPETQETGREMVFFQDKCIGCGVCQKQCHYGALADGLEADRSVCSGCDKREAPFTCVEKCYPQCRKIVGEDKTVQEIIQVVKRDMPFYQLSGGGVTISGGEPLAQPEFLFALLQGLTENWIDTAIETCGTGKAKDYEKIAPYLNFVFVDLKSADQKKHQEWTGADNKLILNNIVRLDELAAEYGFEMIIRTPIIPGFNDTKEEVEKIAAYVSKNCSNYKGMELLPYHKLGRGKYTSLGRIYELADVTVPSDEQILALQQVLDRYHIPIYQF